MSLRFALLALLTVEPMTGYDLSRQFQSSVSHVWHAPDSQIYPELRRMEKDGFVEGREVVWGQRGKKREYHITDVGLHAFIQWMNEPLNYPPERDPVHLRFAYLEWAEPENARAQFEAHIAAYRERRADWAEKIAEIENGTSVILTKRLAGSAVEEHAKIRAFKKYTYVGFIARADQEIAWAKAGIKLLDSLNP